MIVFERAQRADDRVDQPGGAARAAGADRAGARAGAVEEESAFLDRPAVVAADRHAVDLLDVVLPHVGEDQVTRAAEVGAVEAETVGVAKAGGEGLGHLARSLERVAGRDAVLAVGAHRIGLPGVNAGFSGSMRSILPSGVLRFCELPPGSMWLAPTSLALPPSPRPR